jgi:DNA-binding XRE family transcriptional regulator
MKSPATPEPKARAVMGPPEPPEDQPNASEGANASEQADASEAKKPKIRRDGESRGKKRSGLEPNNVRKLRQEAMMSKAELARRAGVSPLTIDRVEAGAPCRMDTKRKILEALGLKPSARTEVWPDIDDQS